MSEVEQPEIVMYSTSWCPDCHRAKHFFDEYGVAYLEVDVDKDEAGLLLVKQLNNGRRVVPTIIFPDGSILVEPSTTALAKKVGVSLLR